jgi:hypothetical protein
MQIIQTIAAIRQQLELAQHNIAELNDVVRQSRATLERSRKVLARLQSAPAAAPLSPLRPPASTIRISPSTSTRVPPRGKRPPAPVEPAGWDLARAVAASLRRMGFVCSVMDPGHPPLLQ